jgi:hypothetical protein
MNASLIVEDLVKLLERRYGRSRQPGKARILTFGSAITCSINYSKLLNGHKFFYAVPQEIIHPEKVFPQTEAGEYVLLVCGSPKKTLVLPRALMTQMLKGVPTRRVDIFLENDAYVLQTTKHPKINVTNFLNAFPEISKPTAAPSSDEAGLPAKDRIHVKVQWGLISLGRAEDCSVWVPTNDRNLSYQQNSFSELTIPRLPNFGFDENTRRIVQNIDVLWLNRNVIRKAFEIESTTSIYSGLLRLNDLILAQPNIQIDLYLVTSTARREKVRSQLARPSFQPLAPKVQSVTFEQVDEKVKTLESLPLKHGARISGLLRGEPFVPLDYTYPSDL